MVEVYIQEKKSLTESSRNDVHLMKAVVLFPNACTMFTIETYGVNLIDKGQGAVLVSNVTQLIGWADRT